MIRYLLVTMMIMLTPPKGSGGLPHAPRPAVVEARVWDKLAAALSFVESRNDDRIHYLDEKFAVLLQEPPELFFRK